MIDIDIVMIEIPIHFAFGIVYGNTHEGWAPPVSLEGQIDFSLWDRNVTADERLVPLLDGAISKGLVQSAQGHIRSSIHDDAAGVHVQSVHGTFVDVVTFVAQMCMNQVGDCA